MDHAVTMALRAKNKLGFVNGSLTTPKKKEDIPTWQLCNDLVTSWILHSVSTEIRLVFCMLILQHKSGPI
jgi:hypothetical protein